MRIKEFPVYKPIRITEKQKSFLDEEQVRHFHKHGTWITHSELIRKAIVKVYGKKKGTK